MISLERFLELGYKIVPNDVIKFHCTEVKVKYISHADSLNKPNRVLLKTGAQIFVVKSKQMEELTK